MKISLKIFVFTYCVMMCITVIGGFALVNYLYKSDMNQAMNTAMESNEVLYTYIASLDDIPDNGYVQYSLTGFMQRMTKDGGNNVFVGGRDEWREKVVLPGYSDLQDGQVISCVIEQDNRKIIQVTSRCDSKYIINYYDITGIIKHRDQNYRLYRKMIIICSMVIAIVLYIFSWYITRPLSQVTRMAEQISMGDYSVRTNTDYRKMKSYEVTKLSETLNVLAEHTEQHIAELEDMASKKEDFVGNFTHEIKTPLTSIIGYADLLRTYDLQPEKRREYSNFIYNEGKRLEQLSINLLQLIVMGRTEFVLTEQSTTVLFGRFMDAVHFSGEKYHVKIYMECEEAVIRVEPVMLTAAVINLVDNACKASKEGQDIYIRGQKQEEYYRVMVEDAGCGIPKNELDKITEPFYMVDKSRARSQGGAGLGLALCKRIAELHDGCIQIESELGAGTRISIIIPVQENSLEESGGEQNEMAETVQSDAHEA